MGEQRILLARYWKRWIKTKMVRILGISRIRENDSATGRISLEEFLAGGTGGLPSFEGYKDLGRKFHHFMKVSSPY